MAYLMVFLNLFTHYFATFQHTNTHKHVKKVTKTQHFLNDTQSKNTMKKNSFQCKCTKRCKKMYTTRTIEYSTPHMQESTWVKIRIECHASANLCVKVKEKWKINTKSLIHSHLSPIVPISLNRKTLYSEHKQKLCDAQRTYLVQPNVIRLICSSLSGLTIRERERVCVFGCICCTHHWFAAYASIRSWHRLNFKFYSSMNV